LYAHVFEFFGNSCASFPEWIILIYPVRFFPEKWEGVGFPRRFLNTTALLNSAGVIVLSFPTEAVEQDIRRSLDHKGPHKLPYCPSAANYIPGSTTPGPSQKLDFVDIALSEKKARVDFHDLIYLRVRA